ncbi:MAG: PulJ/GspJ family protein [Planctomycetota bacterium]
MSRPIKAFTLLELMLSLSVISVMGLTVASVAAALSYAQSHTDEVSESVHSGRSGLLTIESYVRRAKLVTAVQATGMVLWLGDANDDGQINVAELAMVQYKGQAREVRLSRVIFPANLAPDTLELLNTPKALSSVDEMDEVTDEFDRGIYAGYLTTMPLATNVEEFTVATDVAPPLSRLMLLRIKVGHSSDRQIQMTSSTRLRADETANVEAY